VSTAGQDQRLPGFVTSEQEAFLQNLYVAYLKASATAQTFDRPYKIGRKILHLHIAGDGLISVLLPAIAHLEMQASAPADFEVHLWDNDSTNTALPEHINWLIDNMRWHWERYLDSRSEVISLSNDLIHTSMHVHSQGCIVSAIDMPRKVALYWTQSAGLIPYYEHGSPLRTLFHWMVDDENHQFIHAGAVGLPAGGVLLAGKGGSGKSTTALTCLDSELQYVSDDYCLVETEPAPAAYCIYNTAKLVGSDDLERFPALGDQFIRRGLEGEPFKWMTFLYTYRPEKILQYTPLKAILIPRVTGQTDTRLSPATSAAALAAIAPSTLFQLPHAGDQAIHTISKLVRSLPCYYLELGMQLEQIPQVILDLLSTYQV
jgi:hypothetical protein